MVTNTCGHALFASIHTNRWEGQTSLKNSPGKPQERINKVGYLCISQSDCISTDKVLFSLFTSLLSFFSPSPEDHQAIQFPTLQLCPCDFWQMDRKWLNLAKVIDSGLHNIPFISTPPPYSNCHHLIYTEIDKMPSTGLSLLLSFSNIARTGKHVPTSWKHHGKDCIFLSLWAALHSNPDNFMCLLEKTKPV